MARRTCVDGADVGTSVPPPGYVGRAAAPPESDAARRKPPNVIAWALAVAGVAVGAFLLFGSSGSQLQSPGSPNRPSSPIARAASFSSAASGFRMRMSMEIGSSALPTPVTADATAVVDMHDRAAAMSFVLNFGSDPQVVQELGSDTMPMQMVLDGGEFYFKFPSALMAQLPTAGKQWLRLDLGKLTGVPGLSSLGSNPAMEDPSQMLRVLESESTNVIDAGKQAVDGVETTHYRAYLDIDRVPPGLSPSQQAAVQQAISAFEQAAKSEVIPVDVWIDSAGYVRRETMALNLTVSTGASMDETMSADFSDYGPQPRPAVPPASEVEDVSSLSHLGG